MVMEDASMDRGIMGGQREVPTFGSLRVRGCWPIISPSVDYLHLSLSLCMFPQDDRSRFVESLKKKFARLEAEDLEQRIQPGPSGQVPECECLVRYEGVGEGKWRIHGLGTMHPSRALRRRAKVFGEP